MEATTIRVSKQTQKRLKKISGAEHISIVKLIDKLVNEHEKSFWKDFDGEAKEYLDKEEMRTRKTFGKVLKDGIS